MAPFVHFAAIMPRFIFFRTSSGQAIVGKTVAALLPPSAFSFGNPTYSFCVSNVPMKEGLVDYLQYLYCMEHFSFATWTIAEYKLWESILI